MVVEMDYQQPTAAELMDRRYTEIERLKSDLHESDPKPIKRAEAMAVGADMPYNMTALHNERQALRDKMNELESEVQNG